MVPRRRRWFQFSLAGLFGLLLMGSVVFWQIGKRMREREAFEEARRAALEVYENNRDRAVSQLLSQWASLRNRSGNIARQPMWKTQPIDSISLSFPAYLSRDSQGLTFAHSKRLAMDALWCPGIADNVVRLTISDVDLLEDDLKRIGNLKSLERLALHRCGLDDDGLRFLMGLPQIKSIDLSSNNLTPACIALLSKLPKVQSINLEHQLLVGKDAEEAKQAVETLNHTISKDFPQFRYSVGPPATVDDRFSPISPPGEETVPEYWTRFLKK